MCELCDAVKNSLLKHSIPLTLTVDEIAVIVSAMDALLKVGAVPVGVDAAGLRDKLIAVVQADAERLLGGDWPAEITEMEQ